MNVDLCPFFKRFQILTNKIKKNENLKTFQS